jgi:predicted permease
METILRDLRHGLRVLLRNPGVTAVAVLTLALGIGVNTAIFSVVYAVLLRPLPVRDVDRLVTIAQTSRKLNTTGAQPGFSVYASQLREGRWFDAIAAAAPGTAALSSTGSSDESVRFWRVTAGFLPTLGVSPALGRNFLPEEGQPGGAKVAILGQRLWRGRFNGDPRVLGTAVKIDGEVYTIVGVMPAGFHVDGRPADVYTPLARSLNDRAWLPTNIYARLKPGITIEQAQAQVKALAVGKPRGPFEWEQRLWALRDFQVRDVRRSLWVLLGAVGLVLLIACANIATLLLARASARQREVAIRTALGAAKARLVRQMLTESTLLALAGGACGVIVAALCVRLMPLLQHDRLPGLLEQTRVDAVVLAFTLGLSLLTGLIFGTAPALSAPHVNVNETLK